MLNYKQFLEEITTTDNLSIEPKKLFGRFDVIKRNSENPEGRFDVLDRNKNTEYSTRYKRKTVKGKNDKIELILKKPIIKGKTNLTAGTPVIVDDNETLKVSSKLGTSFKVKAKDLTNSNKI
jgi:hypothetical protein